MADNKTPGVEAAAISLLKEAVSLDSSRRFTEALVCYREGIQLLMDVLKTTSDASKRQRFSVKIKEYMERAETLKKCIDEQQTNAMVHEEIHIEDNATGYSYEKIFCKCFDALLTKVEVEDPYIRNNHQVSNFLRFCELLVKSHAPVREIKLLTTHAEGDANRVHQMSKLEEIRVSLEKHGVKLQIECSTSLHDRQIRFNNGWIVKIGRGLDYFRATPSKFSIGFYDMNLRPCYKTTVNIFHSNYTKDRTQ